MMRSVLKLSCVLVVTTLLACSSKSGDEGTGNSGGTNGSIIGGAGGSASSGGSSASSGGSSASSGGSSASSGGTANSAGTTGTAGSSSGGSCTGASVTCVDDTKAQVCNSETGMLQTIDCAAELEPIGLVSSGCMKDATSEGCSIDGFKDEACSDGVAKLIACNYITMNSDAIDAYASCFLHDKNMNGQDIHELVTCVGTTITSDMPTTGDCSAATDTCVAGAMGAAGSGAGGAAP